MTRPTILDCTLRDGGYYNDWDFGRDLIDDYLAAMSAAGVDVVEVGQRFLTTSGFKGPCAYSTDDFLRRLNLPNGMKVAVMVNGADLRGANDMALTLSRLFPEAKPSSPVDIVRIACHLREIAEVLPASEWLHGNGFGVGFNLMQIADRTREEVVEVARTASRYPVDVLYFADSMGSMNPDRCAEIVGWIREGWDGAIGIHTHDNMGLALQNTMRAMDAGVTWLDATVTGMGRGPGNARTEELVIESAAARGAQPNLVPLLALIRRHLQPMKTRYGWGTNPFYFLAGKYGIHPTYIQEMAGDPRYDEEDILAVIEYLRAEGGKKYSADSLNAARSFFHGDPRGTWRPAADLADREILILGSGPGTTRHHEAISAYIRAAKPMVLALNTQSALTEDMIDLRVACHPVRLLADAAEHLSLPQPLATPASMLPEGLQTALGDKSLRDFGIAIEKDLFAFAETACTVPNSLVISYALAIAASGRANRILLAGFDGYEAGDRRNVEMEETLALFQAQPGAPPVVAVTPTSYAGIETTSIYAM